MRLSVNESDPGYHPLFMGATCFLYGEEVKAAITADEDLGFVESYAVDEKGEFLFEPLTGNPIIRIATGAVKIVLEPERRAVIERDQAAGVKFRIQREKSCLTFA